VGGVGPRRGKCSRKNQAGNLSIGQRLLRVQYLRVELQLPATGNAQPPSEVAALKTMQFDSVVNNAIKPRDASGPVVPRAQRPEPQYPG
jgi:hypothetical protein